MKRTIPVLVAALAIPLAAGRASSQSVGDRLAGLARENGELYVQPVFEGLGHAMSSGFLRTPNVHGRLGFDVGVRVMVAITPGARKSFAPALPSTITVDLGGSSRTFSNPYATTGGTESPTAAGKGSGLTLSPTGALADSLAAYGIPASTYALSLPAGFNLPAIPFGVARIGVGIGFGTELSATFTPSIDLGDVGGIGGGGFGIAHQLNQWFVGVPVDLAVFAGYQTFNVGEYLSASTKVLGGAAGKGVGPLSAYLIGQYAAPTVDLEYTVSNPGGNPALPADGETLAYSPDIGGTMRFGVGGQLNLLLLQIAGEYTTGDYDAITARVSLGIR